MSETLVKVENVSKKFCRDLKKSLWYGMKDLGGELLGKRHDRERELRPEEFWAVKDASFELKRGECLGLIGRNGAGKTTLLRMLNGLIKPDRGRIEMRGQVGALIALGAGFNPILTGRENIYVNASVLGLRKKEIDAKLEEIVEFAELGEFIDTPVQSYSSGMVVRLGFAVATALEPDVLILDEVLAVGDARFQVKCINVIGGLKSKGVAIILVSHNMVNILRYCDIGIYLKSGFSVKKGHIEDVTSLYLQDQDPLVTGDFVGNVPTNSGIELHKIYITDENVNIIDKISPFQKIKIHVPYTLTNDFKNCTVVLQLGIDDMEGVFFQGLSKPIIFKGGRKGESGEFIASIDELRAASGTLIIGVALWLYMPQILLSWSRENKVKVDYELNNAGRVQLQPDWSLHYNEHIS